MEKEQWSYWSQPNEEALKRLKSAPEGLSSGEAEGRLAAQGENILTQEKSASKVLTFLTQFKNPIILILLLATGISALTGDWIDAGIILLIILASSVLSFFQEYSASEALKELREKVQVKAKVLRSGQVVELPSRELVAGDVILVSTGSLIPADGILLESLELRVNQSILTGESLPTEKAPGVVPEETLLKDRTNCVFMGTNVQNGSAKVLLVKTGKETAYGAIAQKLTLRPPETEFERGIRHFGYLLTQIMLILTLLVFAINVLYARPAIDSLLFSVALAVGITPQLLPAIISITLAKGSRIMAKSGVIVRRLNAIENFGSMDILCTDKTGTLTEGLIRIDGACSPWGDPSDDVYRMAYLNASFQSGMSNSIDDAIREAQNIDVAGVVKTGEVPFDFHRSRLSIVVEEKGKRQMITKGSLKGILAISSRVFWRGEEQAKTSEITEKILSLFTTWSGQGIRVLGVASKEVSAEPRYTVEDETEMTFQGFLLLFDHPKPDVQKTIEDLAQSGVSLRIITGDNPLIAVHTAQAVGLPITGVLTGEELRSMSDEALWQKIGETTIFAEVDPNQKERIILALKKKSHVVGYMGDGINDVPALHAADVSICVNNAADIAKESADLVLLESGLDVLHRGILLGRTTFNNTLKYIQVTTSANFGNMFSMAGASLFLPFLPLLPKQILLLNFLSDFPAMTIAQDSVDAEVLAKPRRWNVRFIRDFMFVFGFISSLFDYLTFGVLLLYFRADEATFQSSWFTISVLTEILILLVMRTRKPFFRSRPAPLLLLSSLFVALFTLLLPFLPFSSFLGLEPMKPVVLLVLFGITLLYILTTETVKVWFFRRKSQD